MPGRASAPDVDDLTSLLAEGAQISGPPSGKALTLGFNSAVPGAARGFSRRLRDGTRAQNPLPGVPPDVKAMTKLLRQRGMQVEEHLVGHGGKYKKVDKRTVVKMLNKLFNDKSTNKFVIYVAGHGVGDDDEAERPIGVGGNWVLDNYYDPDDQKFLTVSLREIMTLWLAAKRKRYKESATDDEKEKAQEMQLAIIHDVCYGGTVSAGSISPTSPSHPTHTSHPNCVQWVEELKQIERDAGSELGVAVQASTSPHQPASDGFFTEIFTQKQDVDGRRARLAGTRLVDGEVVKQHPMYHVAWRGPRGGQVKMMELNNGSAISFYQHSGARLF